MNFIGKWIELKAMDSQKDKVYPIIFAGGGTGGHLYPAIAIAEELQRQIPNCEIHFIGTQKGIETRVISASGYRLHLIAVRGVQRGRLVANMWVPFRLIWSFIQSLVILIKVRPKIVVGTGGYVSGPVLFMAALLGMPTIIQEQNSFPGATTRLLARRVDMIFLTYEVSKKYFKDKNKLIVSGNPVRSFARASLRQGEARMKFGLDSEKFTVFVFGGSQGARGINKAVSEMAPKILAWGTIQLLWSAGPQGIEQAQAMGHAYPKRCSAHEFIFDMAAAYAASDLVICRAGATTLAEIAICELPAILIPFPFAAAGHQESNARALADLAAAEVILESNLTADLLSERILYYFKNKSARIKMSENLATTARPNAARDIVAMMIKIAKLAEQV